MNISFSKFVKKEYVALFFILLLAIFFRFWNVQLIPPSASLDEQSIGWNAYSVLKTGGDEYGQFPLISQRGYDDWRRSTYLLLTIPTIGLFGLNPVAERLPSVILSVLTVFSSFWIVKLLFAKQTKYASITALLVALFLAISPWHIYISRLGHESNACLSFLVFGVLFFLLGEKKKKFSLLLLSFIFFTLSMISYYSGQIFVPILLFALVIMYWKTLLSITFANKKTIIITVISLLFFGVIFADVFSPNSLVRFNGTSTFTPSAHPDLFKQMVELHNDAVKHGNVIGSIFYNRRFYPIIVFAQGYFSHFDPRWLIFNAGTDPFKAPNMGLLYIWELPFILLGMLVILCSKELDKKSKILIFLWFLLGPLPAAVATQAPHAMRSYNFLPTWQIFTAFGLTYIMYKLKKVQVVGLVLLALLLLYSLTTLYKNYFIEFPMKESQPYQYAMGNAMEFLHENRNKYQDIVVSNKDNLFQSYMFYLFYTKYDPKRYQKMGGTISGGFAQTHKIDNITFRPINWKSEKPGTLLIGNPFDFPKGTPVLFTSYYLDGQTGVVIEQR